jgi:serine/threonine protein kinase
MIGTVLHDRWRILRELGRGGMGEVYLAEHIALKRHEALKILTGTLANDPQFVARFRREARAVNRLRHPNIISIYDFGQLPDGRFYLTMEYADGEAVSQMLRRDEMIALPRGVHLLAQLAYAVHHAHSRGVVHRDIKPSNLVVLADDTLKVLDFGMAKIVGGEGAESRALSSADNAIWGTAKYMAPERIMGIGNDPRSDLYSIGCVAYEILAGAPPFVGTSNEIIDAHLSREPLPPSAVRPALNIPAELDAVILKCLAKELDARFQTAAELYAAVRKVPGYSPPREARRRFVPLERNPSELHVDRPGTDPFGNLRGVLRQLAEALLDAGANEPRLVSGAAYLHDHELSLARLEAAQDALEHEAAAVRDTTGEREIALRFARGELEQEHPSPQIAETIRELDARLAATRADTARLEALESGIAQVRALRTQCLDELKQAYVALERVVDEVVPAYLELPSIEPLVKRLAVVKRLRPPPTHS